MIDEIFLLEKHFVISRNFPHLLTNRQRKLAEWKYRFSKFDYLISDKRCDFRVEEERESEEEIRLNVANDRCLISLEGVGRKGRKRRVWTEKEFNGEKNENGLFPFVRCI